MISEKARNLIDTHGFAELTEYIAEVEAELVDARKDCERLDWLEASIGFPEVDVIAMGEKEWTISIDGKAAHSESIREAIDAARLTPVSDTETKRD